MKPSGSLMSEQESIYASEVFLYLSTEILAKRKYVWLPRQPALHPELQILINL